MGAFRLALANLLHDWARSAVSVVGTACAVLLIFMQLGFLGALRDTATLLYDRLDFDLLVTSSEYINLDRPGAIDRDRLAEARAALPDADITPLSAQTAQWRNPSADPARGGKQFMVLAVGIDPGRLDRTFRPADRGVFPTPAARDAARPALNRLDAVLLDRRSRADFGQDPTMVGPGNPNAVPPGTVVEVNGRQVEMIGYVEIGTGFSYTGLMVTNEETFARTTGLPAGRVTFGLVKLPPGADPEAAARRATAALPRDAQVFTRQEVVDNERRFWVEKTSIGQIFTSGVVLALFVGAVFVYQMMVADIKRHLGEYATLKAIGYRFAFLFRVVVGQAVLLAVGGYALGLAGAYGLYALTRAEANLPIAMNPERLVLVFALAVGMCVGSGLVAVRKVRTADPADLF
jgi:putative ABC transport system permease protein